MTPELKRRLAREWLIFVVCFLVGLLVVPLAMCLLQRLNNWIYYRDFSLGKPYVYFVLDLLAFLYRGGDSPAERHFVWAVLLGPYVVLQFVRSTIWSIKTLADTDRDIRFIGAGWGQSPVLTVRRVKDGSQAGPSAESFSCRISPGFRRFSHESAWQPASLPPCQDRWPCASRS